MPQFLNAYVSSSVNSESMCTHTENRTGVCRICWQKSCEKMAIKLCNIIQEYVVINYDPATPVFPYGLGSSCRAVLHGISRSKNKRYLNAAQSFDPDLTASTRSDCQNRSIARVKGPLGVTSRKRTSTACSANPSVFAS